MWLCNQIDDNELVSNYKIVYESLVYSMGWMEGERDIFNIYIYRWYRMKEKSGRVPYRTCVIRYCMQSSVY